MAAHRHEPTLAGNALALGAPFALWIATVALVSPSGAFPLNDDWIYARAVKDWIDSGTYSGHPFSTANLVAQAWWGKLFCAAGGFSFNALRWSTLVLWLVAALATSRGALMLGARPAIAALAGALILANPIAMNLGYTFMTDVPFMALMAMSGIAYLRGLERPRWTIILLASLLGATALLVRQFAVLLPLAFVLASGPWEPRWRTSTSVPLLVALIAPWAAAWGLLQFLPSHAAELGHTWDPGVLGHSWSERFWGGVNFQGGSLILLGLCTLPLALAPAGHWLRKKPGRATRRAFAWAAAVVFLVLTACRAQPGRIPFLGNVLYDMGTGPMTLRGIFMGSYLWRPVSIEGWWWIPTAVGIFVAAWCIAGTLRWLLLLPGDGRGHPQSPRRRQQAFLMLWAVLMMVALYHPWLPVRFDRYLLGALVPLVLLMAMAPALRGRLLLLAQWGAFAVIYGFSLFGVQDYLAWNTTRWAMLNELMHEENIPPEQIDGGYEFNGWYTSPGFIEKDGATAFLRSGPLGWWVVDDQYAISWLPRPGFDTIGERPYDSWLAGEKGKLLLLKKKPDDGGEKDDAAP